MGVDVCAEGGLAEEGGGPGGRTRTKKGTASNHLALTGEEYSRLRGNPNRANSTLSVVEFADEFLVNRQASEHEGRNHEDLTREVAQEVAEMRTVNLKHEESEPHHA